jgi:Holliday junction resolvase RusA-like endonuclease
MIQFAVHGIAQPAGSKRAFIPKRRDGSLVTRVNGSPMVSIVDANPKAKSWKQEVASAAAAVMLGRTLLQGPLRLSVVFIMPRPLGHYGSGKNEGIVKPRAPRWHTVKPDVTKLIRAVEDALTGIVWRDDSQVCEASQCKIYGESASVRVSIEELREDHELPSPKWGSPVGSSI